jgi:hypothetical protein
MRSGKLCFERALIFLVLSTWVIGKEAHIMIAGKVPEDIVGADLASGVHRQEFPRFDPENAHILKNPRT